MKFAFRFGYVLGVALAGSCTHTTPSPNGVFVSARPQIVAPDDRGEATPQPEGQALRPGQVFALDLQLQYPAHVYVIHRRGGLLGNVYPGVGIADSELSPGTVRLPGRDTWMRVPQLERQSRLCVLLSAQPLDPQLRHCPDGHSSRNHQRPAVQSFLLPVAHTP
jgi:hypothetical protein